MQFFIDSPYFFVTMVITCTWCLLVLEPANFFSNLSFIEHQNFELMYHLFFEFRFEFHGKFIKFRLKYLKFYWVWAYLSPIFTSKFILEHDSSGQQTVLHRSMMAHTKVRIQRYVSLKKNSHCWSFHSTKVMLFVQVRTERSIEFYQIMLLNIEYDMSLSRPHSKIMLFFTTATIFLKETSIYLYFCFF